MYTIAEKILRKIRGHGVGWVFSPTSFQGIGSRAAVESTIRRLVNNGRIRRIAHGLYDYPRTDPQLGMLAPPVDKIITALEERDAVRLQPSGAYAANLLGLSNQVPMKLVFLTDGPSRKLQVDKVQIHLRRTTPRNMATAGRVSGTVIQALRWMGLDHADSETVGILRDRLNPEEKAQLLKDIQYAPIWIAELVRIIAAKNEAS
jgi:hypothetical protein